MRFLFGVVVGIWIGCIGAACIIATNNKFDAIANHARMQRCLSQLEEAMQTSHQTQFVYSAAIKELAREKL